jgi:preprotein translocase subunit SecD
MFLSSVYVLLPTYLDEGDIDTSGFNSSAPAEEATLQVRFDVSDAGVDEGTVEAVDARLRAAEVRVDRVGAEGARLTVYMRSGERKSTVERIVAHAGEASAYDVTAVGVDADLLAKAEDPDALLASTLGSMTLASDAAPLSVTITTLTWDENTATTRWDGAPPEGVSVLAVDGTLVGFAFASGSADAGTVYTLLDGADAGLLAAAASGPIPEALTRVVIEAADDDDGAAEEVKVEEIGGLASLLPDTKLNLGLDLQGGIDLTLQVGQEEAVFSQVQRDRASLRDRALKDDVSFDVLRDRTRPAMKFNTDGDFSVLREYLSEQLPAYVYVESMEEEGKNWHVFQMNEEREEEIKAQAVEQVLETLRKRVDSTGVKEPSIVRMPAGRINIQLPGVEDSQQAVDAIGTQAILEFRLVDMEADSSLVARYVTEAQAALPPEQFTDVDVLNEWLRREGKLPPERIVRFMDRGGEGSSGPPEPMQLHEEVMLTGADVNDASVQWDQANQPQVAMGFKPRGGGVFCTVTTEHVKDRFAIMLDGEIRSAPTIQEPICGGRASISMGNSVDSTKDANTLALVLRTGSLTAPVEVGEVREIGPSLGADSIRSGAIGSAFGGMITLVFMGLWYRKPGLIADVALSLNVLMVFALLALMGATLTLPGIAGIALTIGMAVDANIIIYERIREELRLGVAARKAVGVGYSKGVVAVLDANVTTAIAGVVLYSYGTGPIKGFAVTLLIGIFTTLVTALFVTRTFMEMLTRNSNVRLRI